MACERPFVRRAIEAMFATGRIAPRRWRALHEHLFACGECRAYYERVMLLERKLTPGGGALSPLQLALVGQAVLTEVAPAPSRLFGFLRAWSAMGIALAATVAAVVLFAPRLERAPDGRFAARGAGGESGLGVRAVCVGGGDASAFVRGAFPGAAEARCDVEDTLHLTYSNAVVGPYEYLFVFGVDAALEPHWYYPTPREAGSLRIDSDAADEQLPGGIRLAVNHSAGPLRIFALFSHAPLSVDAVEAQVRLWRESGVGLDAIDPSGLGDAERSVALDLEEGR